MKTSVTPVLRDIHAKIMFPLFAALLWIPATPVAADALTAKEASELARYVYAEFDRICLANHADQRKAGPLVDNDPKYTPHNESEKKNERWVRDTTLDNDYDVSLTIRAGGIGRCQLAVWWDAGRLFDPLLTQYVENNNDRPVAAIANYGENLKLIRFRREGYGYKGVGRIVHLDHLESGSVVIGLNNLSEIPVYEPGTKWKYELADERYFSEPVKLHSSVITMRDHKMRIVQRRNKLQLVFEPDFYNWMGDDKPHSPYRQPGKLFVDGKELKASARCFEKQDNCEKIYSRPFMVDLDATSIDQLKNGHVLATGARTSAKETFTFFFPLQGVAEQIARVMKPNHDLALVDAIKSKDKTKAGYAIDAGADPGLTLKNGKPAFIEAMYKDQMDIARRLIEKGADINAPYPDKDNNWRSPLLHALFSSWDEHLERVLSLGAEPVVSRSDGKISALFFASSIEELELLSRFGADVHARNGKGQTLLHVFAGGEPERLMNLAQPDEFKWVARQGLAIDAQDSAGNTPLMLAINSGSSKIIDWLLANNVDTTATNKKGRGVVGFVENRLEYLYKERADAEGASEDDFMYSTFNTTPEAHVKRLNREIGYYKSLMKRLSG